MKRRKLLAGIGIGALAGKPKPRPSIDFIGQVLFVESDLTYGLESELANDAIQFHIDQPPTYAIKNKTLYLNEMRGGSNLRQLAQNRDAVINYRRLRGFSNQVVDETSTRVLPVASGPMGQPTVGVLLGEPINAPNYGILQNGENEIIVRAFNESKNLKPNETAYFTGSSVTVPVRTNLSGIDEVSAYPKLKISNQGNLDVKAINQ